MFIISLLSWLKGVLIQEKRLFDIMAHEVGTFFNFRGAAEVLQIQMEKWFFLLISGDGHSCKAHQSNALLQYIYFLAGRGGYLHWLVYDLQYHQPGSTTSPVLKQ